MKEEIDNKDLYNKVKEYFKKNGKLPETLKYNQLLELEQRLYPNLSEEYIKACTKEVREEVKKFYAEFNKALQGEINRKKNDQ